jgi:hypothetical protein
VIEIADSSVGRVNPGVTDAGSGVLKLPLVESFPAFGSSPGYVSLGKSSFSLQSNRVTGAVLGVLLESLRAILQTARSLWSSPENLQTGLHAGMSVGFTKLGFGSFPELSAEGTE